MDSTDAKVINSEQTISTYLTRGVSVPVERDSLDYKMKSVTAFSRKAYIFNHENYLNNPEASRKGTNVDRDALLKVLPTLGFQVECFDDLSVGNIRQKIKELSQPPVNYDNDDCLMIVVLTHGEEGGFLHAFDGTYNANVLWNPFTPDKCPSLAGKPKLFFIQACRGNKLDEGVQVKCDSLLDNGGSNQYILPKWADFMYAYSTISGYASWRNTENGSYFIRALCETLSEHGKTEDLLSMMTMVVHKVATSELSNETGTYAQTACIVTQLIRRVYFDPKN